MLTKNNFEKIFYLSSKQPWLAEKVNAISQLLFEDCQSHDEQELIIDLLTRFKYLNETDIQQILKEIVESLTKEQNCTENNSCIVATTMDSSADSAQYILYRTKPIFQDIGWHSPKLINQGNKIIRELPVRNQIFYIDEFIGSGRSIIGRVKSLRRELETYGHNDYRIKVYCVAASRYGIEALHKENIEIYSSLTLEKGITDFYLHDAPNKISLMKKIEGLLSNDFNGREMPSLGYGQVEALYARQHGNTPNNVFPVFWWPFYKGKDIPRKTVLTRSMGDA